MTSRRWLYGLGAALGVDLLFSVWGWVDNFGDFRAGRHDTESSLAVAGLALLVVVIVTGVGATRSFLSADGEVVRRGQFIDAVGSTSHDWLWETDRDGRFVYSSESVEQLLGYAPRDVLGMSSHDLLFDDAVRAMFTTLRVEHGWDDLELSWRRRDGSAVLMVGSAVAVRDNSGRVVGYRGARRLAAQGSAVGDRGADDRITQVLADSGFGIALQPLMSIRTGCITGVEALARFADGRGPDAWFQDAQACGRTRDLDAATFAAALGIFALVPDPVYLSVNASPELLMDPGFTARLRASSAPLDRLVVEVTEHAPVADYAELNTVIDPLRELGVRFAIDDTGAGYASLSHVLQLRPDVIKLDRALITHLNEDRARRSLVTALVLLALDLGASVTGEGVETLGQLETLSTLGVDQVQGYVIARPTLDRRQWKRWWHEAWLPGRTLAAHAPDPDSDQGEVWAPSRS